MTTASPQALLSAFRASLSGEGLVDRLAAGVIGEGQQIDGGFGAREMIYADYVASGRALMQVERFVLELVLPFYANSHTEASYCGSFMTRLRGAVRAEISRLCGAGEGYATIFCGSGATAGLNRLVHLLDLKRRAEAEPPLVLIGPYEHHSNILPWRESAAQVIEIGEAPGGGPDLHDLQRHLSAATPGRQIIGAFSALSNVTGLKTDVARVNQLLKTHGALSVWDFAGGGPYLPIDMSCGGGLDAVVVSPHKFPGGPGASGILIVKRAVVLVDCPSLPGGGTVRFVSPSRHDYSERVEVREEAGTPNVIGDIRAALVFLVKEALGQVFLDRRHEELKFKALRAWTSVPGLEILGDPETKDSLPIFSFRIRDPRGEGFLHPQLVTRMLSDLFGVQARGGCACAGPYAHRLLGIGDIESDRLRKAILAGDGMMKPGWTRLNLSVLMSDAKADKVITAVAELARAPYPACLSYVVDESTARFRGREYLMAENVA
ncbi:aminotransferase class V-fold PLP-dependent enzyme [Roseibium sp.]|uniref:aminotransferase class V-fold PLP-dependent enzyme n=1 Tax=Roseibium sp. TaxID=1936156 RepID=UPI003A983125